MKWSILTLVGADQSGMVAAVTDILYKNGCSLAQASMIKLGANFTIMLRVSHEADKNLQQILAGISKELNLHCHIDVDVTDDAAAEKDTLAPDVQVSVYGADKSGIVAQVTAALAMAGLNIIDLETDVAGSVDKPIYIMTLEGVATKGIKPLQNAIEALTLDAEINLNEIDTLRG
ncbi:hypothetical protein MNBD_GAMMA07-788 [hydrothermal vent metagenome]|uniref:ACT domain-containing protein n=1 Tax=hydrothermal vent metagenome TaxID=652676 RepID=A0A3B0WQE4_9ZZZZ